jgi:hypothetical protein
MATRLRRARSSRLATTHRPLGVRATVGLRLTIDVCAALFNRDEKGRSLGAVISESEGVSTLKRCFEAAGLTIVLHHPLRVGGRTIHLDGYDPQRKIGFEYMTSEAGDRAELNPDVVAELEAHMRLGDYYLLLIDEREVDSVQALERAAEHFLRVAIARRGAAS